MTPNNMQLENEEIYRDLYFDSLPYDWEVFPLSNKEKKAIDKKVKNGAHYRGFLELWKIFHGDKQLYCNNTYLLFKVFDKITPKQYDCIEISPELARKLVSGKIGYTFNGVRCVDSPERSKHILTKYVDNKEFNKKIHLGFVDCLACPGGCNVILNKNLKGDEMRFISCATTPWKCIKVKLYFEACEGIDKE